MEIVRRQTTYWDIRGDDDRTRRLHFVGKEESVFHESRVTSVDVVEQHPVLADYEHSWEGLYLTARAPPAAGLLTDLRAAIERLTGGWRSAEHYFNPHGVERILGFGSGLLLAAPVPIVQACSTALGRCAVTHSRLPGRAARWPRRALVAGASFVVAVSFRSEVLD